MQDTFPFDVSAGVDADFRRWIGTITWTRDLATQIVDMHIVADKTGPSTLGLYIYWFPPYTIPVELQPEIEQFPYISPVTITILEGGEGYLYMGGSATAVDVHYRYVTGAPIVEEELPPTGSLLGDVNALVALTGVQVWPGYAPTGAALPYAVSRPLDVGHDDELAITGDAHDWNVQISVYCCAASVEASFNLALAVIGTLQGARMRGTTLSASMGYNGAEVEGHYESQVTVQLNQGGF